MLLPETCCLMLIADVKLAPFTTIIIQDMCNLNLKMEVCVFFFNVRPAFEKAAKKPK